MTGQAVPPPVDGLPAGGIVGVFDRAAATYDAVGVPWFGPIAEGLVRALDPRPGQRVADLGCGTGAALLRLAEAVGPTGRVDGLDLAPAMVAAARAAAAARGLRHVEVRPGDASAPALAGSSYDVVASSLVLFFLPDPAAAVAAWRGLLRPGGRLGVATFGPVDPVWQHVDEVFAPHLPARMRDARTTGRRGPFASDAGVEGLLRGAGLEAVRTVSGTVEVAFRDADQWHEWTWSHGQRAMWECVPPGAREAVRREAAARLEAARRPDGTLGLVQQVRHTLGTRPA